jgi:nucleoid DNA-binding protein
LNTKEFIKELAEKLGVPQTEASTILRTSLEVISEALGKGKNISIQKLGSFSVKKVESRKMFSPKLKKYVLTAPKNMLEFHPSNSLKEKIKNIRTP